MLQGTLVDLATCLLSQRLPLMKDIVSQFASQFDQESIATFWVYTGCYLWE